MMFVIMLIGLQQINHLKKLPLKETSRNDSRYRYTGYRVECWSMSHCTLVQFGMYAKSFSKLGQV